MSKNIKQQFRVTGMSCASCAISVESMLSHTQGVKQAVVNYANGTAMVEYDQEIAEEQVLRKAVQSIGYDLEKEEARSEDDRELAQIMAFKRSRNRTIIAALLTIPVVLLGMFFMDFPYMEWISMGLTFPVVFIFGKSFFIRAWKQLKQGKANMDTLVALSTGIAFIFSLFNTLYPEFWHERGLHAHVYYEAASVIIVFISLGKLLEEKAKLGTAGALKSLMGMQPKTVRKIEKMANGDEEEIEMAIERIGTGDEIRVRPGERIAVDGMVTEGLSYVDESMITGEPIPAERKAGDEVFTGTINQKGSLRVLATKVGGETLLSGIIKSVREAQGSKAPVQKLVDKIAGIFVPIVIGISILTFWIWIFIGGFDAFSHALLAAITVLVIACPCALGLATPTAIMVGVGKAARNQILIKDAESLEIARNIDTVVLDKTGTITKGKPEVMEMRWFNHLEAEETMIYSILYQMEGRSEHPLAAAITEKLKNEKLIQVGFDLFESITGAGIKAVAIGKTYWAGSSKLLALQGLKLDDESLALTENWQNKAMTVVYYFESERLLGMFGIADQVKESSAEAIQELHEMGVEVHMLTGDAWTTAKTIGSQMGLNHIQAEVKPSDKAKYIKQLKMEGRKVAMVGDGVNDSEALAVADLSIAMGHGSDIAMDVAGITLITSDLKKIKEALEVSRKTVAGIRQNLFWAFIYNLIGIPLAAGILYPINGFLLDPMIAGGAMALSSISVVLNSLRLSR